MESLKKSLLLDPNDNVIVAVEPMQKGENTPVCGEKLAVNEFIRQGHKIARQDIPKGTEIVKYGEHIGVASSDIKKGDWVHEHNVFDDFEEISRRRTTFYRTMSRDALDYSVKVNYKEEELKFPKTIMGFKRADGSFGIRNQILVISLVQCSNHAARKIATACDVPVTCVDAACGEFPERFARTRSGFIAAGTHPNVFGAVLLSLGCQQTDPEDVAGEIRRTGRPVVSIVMQDGGVLKAIQDGIEAVRELKEQALKQAREACPLSGLVIGDYCGGSDWTSGLSANPVVGEVIDMHSAMGGSVLHVCGRGGDPTEASSYEVGMQLMDIADFFNADCTRRAGKGLSQVNPTPGNKAGGLTTMIEKNIGSQKTAGHGRMRGILRCGEKIPEPGEWGIDQAQGANDAYATTTLAMSGCHICLFTTGRGNPIGNACMVTIKVTGNSRTADVLSDMIDFSAVPVLHAERTARESARSLYETMLRIANGEPTKAELLGDYSWLTPHGTSYNGDY